MPCNSDYMKPSEKEEQLKLTAELYCWLQSIQHKRAPAWAHKAAGDTYGKGGDKLVAKLCGEMKRLKGVIPPHRDSVGDIMRCGQLTAWWAEHQQADKARLRAERFVRIREVKRQKALAKLTMEERELLGLS